MNKRKRRYFPWRCELEPETDMVALRQMAEANGISYLELTRRVIRFGARHPRFNPKREYPPLIPQHETPPPA